MTDSSEWKERVEQYRQFRDDLWKRQLSNAENFDKAILTLSSAAIGLSMTFLSKYENELSNSCFLYIGWILQVSSIIATLASYIIGQWGITLQLEITYRYFLEKDDSALNTQNHWAKKSESCTVAAGVCFVLGIITLMVFFAINI